MWNIYDHEHVEHVDDPEQETEETEKSEEVSKDKESEMGGIVGEDLNTNLWEVRLSSSLTLSFIWVGINIYLLPSSVHQELPPLPPDKARPAVETFEDRQD